MRFLAIIVAGLATLGPTIVVAQSADELRAQGEEYAKQGRFTEAIDAFKASNKLVERASNDCLIALAYTRRELWPQAEIFLDQCHRRATASDPLPDWVPIADQQLAERLANVNVAAVEITVDPAGTDVKLAVSSFAPDELFAPRTIHLPPGHHVIVATATGYPPITQSVDVVDRTPQHVTVHLHGRGSGSAPGTVRARGSAVPTLMIGVGGGLVVVGAIVHVALFRPARADLQAASDAGDDVAWRQISPRFDRWRTATIGLYAAGAISVGVGIVLRQTVFKHTDAGVEVTAVPADGGGLVTVGWVR